MRLLRNLLIFIAIFGLVLLGIYKSNPANRDLSSHSCRVEGKVLSINEVLKRSDNSVSGTKIAVRTVSIEYSYVIDAREIKRFHEVPVDQKSDYTIGESLVVFYDCENPGSSHLASN